MNGFSSEEEGFPIYMCQFLFDLVAVKSSFLRASQRQFVTYQSDVKISEKFSKLRISFISQK